MLVETKKLNKREMNVVTSLDVAETFEKEHRRVLLDIKKLACSEEFRQHNFVPISFKDSMNREKPMYCITRDGFTLLVMDYTGEKSMKFKEAYIRQFNAMEAVLQEKLIEREKGIAVRQVLTKAIEISGENERMHGFAYSTYTDLIYKTVFGKNAKQLREEYGITKNNNLRDLFSHEELAKVKSVEMVVSGLVDCGWGYDEVKDFVTNGTRKLIAA